MKLIIDNRMNLTGAPDVPLATYVGPFARLLREQGYGFDSTQQQVRLAAGFSKSLRQRDVVLRGITSDHPQQYLRYRVRRMRLCRGDAAAFRHLLDFLRHEEAIPTEKQGSTHPLTSAGRRAQAFEQHLRVWIWFITATGLDSLNMILWSSLVPTRTGSN